MKNIEIKVEVNDIARFKTALRRMKAKRIGRLKQADSYFQVKKGRLKLREISTKGSELIFYLRPDTAESKISSYEVVKIDDSQTIKFKKAMNESVGIKVVVKKSRELWIYKNTRIHLDKVDKLGEFLELETVVDGIPMGQASKEHAEVIDLLGLGRYKKIEKSYSDLLLKRNK